MERRLHCNNKNMLSPSIYINWTFGDFGRSVVVYLFPELYLIITIFWPLVLDIIKLYNQNKKLGGLRSRLQIGQATAALYEIRKRWNLDCKMFLKLSSCSGKLFHLVETNIVFPSSVWQWKFISSNFFSDNFLTFTAQCSFLNIKYLSMRPTYVRIFSPFCQLFFISCRLACLSI